MTDDRAALAVVVVHGIGQQRVGATLLNWAEPLTRSLEDLAARNERSLELDCVQLEHTPPAVDFVLRHKEKNARILLREAHWADSFPAPSAGEVLRWVRRFSVRATFRFVNNLMIQPFTNIGRATVRFYDGTRAAGTGGGRRLLGAIAYMVVIYLGVLCVPLLIFLFAIQIVVVPVLSSVLAVLLIVARWLPIVGPRAVAISAGLVTSIGDAFTFTTRRIHAGAMCQAVSSSIDAAVRDARAVCVIAHSQGAAIALQVLLRDHPSYRSESIELITVGAAVELLNEAAGGPSIDGRTRNLVHEWADDPFPWTNFWTALDPVSAGPIAQVHTRPREGTDTAPPPSFGERVQTETYYSESTLDPGGMGDQTWSPWSAIRKAGIEFVFGDGRGLSLSPVDVALASPDSGLIGPQERKVHNSASVFTDHVTYVGNLEQVCDPIARILLTTAEKSWCGVEPPPFRPEARAPHVARTRRVRSLGFARLLAFATTALVALQLQEWLNKSWVAQLLATHGPAMIVGMLPDPLEVSAPSAVTEVLRFTFGYLWFIVVSTAMFWIVSAFTMFLWSWWNNAVQRSRHWAPRHRPILSILIPGVLFRLWYLLLAVGFAFQLRTIIRQFGDSGIGARGWVIDSVLIGVVVAAALFGPAALGITRIAIEQRASDSAVGQRAD